MQKIFSTVSVFTLLLMGCSETTEKKFRGSCLHAHHPAGRHACCRAQLPRSGSIRSQSGRGRRGLQFHRIRIQLHHRRDRKVAAVHHHRRQLHGADHRSEHRNRKTGGGLCERTPEHGPRQRENLRRPASEHPDARLPICRRHRQDGAVHERRNRRSGLASGLAAERRYDKGQAPCGQGDSAQSESDPPMRHRSSPSSHWEESPSRKPVWRLPRWEPSLPMR